MMLLAGDLGGTKTNLAVFSTAESPAVIVAAETFPSAQYANLDDLVKEFLGRHDFAIERASFGVAGPVVAEHATITNLPWVIDALTLRDAFGLDAVSLINDLSAVAHAVPLLQPHDLYVLNSAHAVPGGSMAIIAPGTGLGEAFLTWDGARYHAYPSEGGHSDFAPTTPLQHDLLSHLQERFEHVSYERVCSGIGLPNLYAFLKDRGYAEEPAWLAERLAAAVDPTPVIVEHGLAGDAKDEKSVAPLCTATLDLFVEILGAEAGNLALTVLATGGVYIGGGLARRVLPLLEGESFMKAFRNKGRFSELLSQMPMYAILNDKAALLGAAYYGFDLARK